MLWDIRRSRAGEESPLESERAGGREKRRPRQSWKVEDGNNVIRTYQDSGRKTAWSIGERGQRGREVARGGARGREGARGGVQDCCTKDAEAASERVESSGGQRGRRWAATGGATGGYGRRKKETRGRAGVGGTVNSPIQCSYHLPHSPLLLLPLCLTCAYRGSSSYVQSHLTSFPGCSFAQQQHHHLH
jgi:hypothetical protein